MSYQNKLLGVLILCLLPYLILFFYCHPSGDDFSYAVLGTKQPILRALLDEYTLWNGRYSSNIFVLKNPLIFQHSWIWIYRCSLLAIFIFSGYSLYFFFNYFFDNFLSKGWIRIVSLTFLLLNIFQMPILSEGTYWYTGVVTYQLANSLFLFYIVVLHYFSALKDKAIKFFIFILLFFTCIFLAGFNEVMMLLLVIFHMICVWIQLKYKLLNYRWFIGLFIASIIGFCIVYFAPGNKIREAYFIGESHRFLYSLVHTCLQIIRFIFEWFSSGVLILLSLVYLAIYPYIEKQVFAIINFLHLNKWISLCSLLGVLFISIFPAYWSTGMMGQHRTVNSAYFYFLFLWFINLTLWRNTKFIQKIIVNKRIINYSLIAVIVLLGCSNNSYYVWKDLFTQNASSFDKEMNKRYELLNNFSKQSDALRYLPVLTSKPSSIYVYDIRKDPKYFPNTCYKSYWKLNSYIVGK